MTYKQWQWSVMSRDDDGMGKWYGGLLGGWGGLAVTSLEQGGYELTQW
jgi:hypothetical protein